MALFEDPDGPIERFAWGQFIISGQEHSDAGAERVGAGKDIRAVGQEVSRWKERKGHRLTPEMITGVYDQGVETLIIGIGVHGLIQCPAKVQRAIQEHGIGQLILERTPDACRTYNALHRQGVRVALLAHGTC